MQVVALVTGDEFLISYNLTIDTADFMGYLRNLSWDWRQGTWRRIQYHFEFDERFGTNFSEILGPIGICTNFNMIQADELFYLDRLPEVFNYKKDIEFREQIFKYRVRAQHVFRPYPLKVSDPRAGLLYHIHQVRFSKPFDVNHHEKFITQGFKIFIHNPYEMFSEGSILHQTIVNHSMIILLQPKKTEIDEALESYEPKRFETNTFR
jgi:hypothetical protein